jgi:hypothetical protein
MLFRHRTGLLLLASFIQTTNAYDAAYNLRPNHRSTGVSYAQKMQSLHYWLCNNAQMPIDLQVKLLRVLLERKDNTAVLPFLA